MATKPVLLNYKKEFEEVTLGADGAVASTVVKNVTGNVILLVREDVISYFNIPAAPEAEVEKAKSTGVTTVDAFTYNRFKDITDETGTAVNVRSYQRMKGAFGEKSAFNVVTLETQKLTAKKNPRTCSIRFPAFFNLIMISQAVGSMIKVKNPPTYRCNGNRYALIQGTATDIVAPAKSGAWVSQTAIAPVNTDDVKAVGGSPIVTGGSGAKNAKNTTATP